MGYHHRNAHSGCVPCGPGRQSNQLVPYNPITTLRQCEKCPPGTQQWRDAHNCTSCPAEGIDCTFRDRIKVLHDFYRADDDDPTAVRCPMRDACVGGLVAGHARGLNYTRGPKNSCAPGYTSVLCGTCAIEIERLDGDLESSIAHPPSGPPSRMSQPTDANSNASAVRLVYYYRAKHSCERCPRGGGAVVVALLVGMLLVGGFVLVVLYLHYSHPFSMLRLHSGDHTEPTQRDESNGRKQNGTPNHWIDRCAILYQRLEKYLPDRLPQQISSICKVLLGHLQVISAFREFSYVKWPSNFIWLLERLRINLQIELLPFDCVASTPLTFFERLLLTLALPVGLICLFICVNAMSAFSWSRRSPRWADVDTPALWSVSIWTLLIFYPSVCRKTLETFACIELRGKSYLAADTSIVCDEPHWWHLVLLSVIGICVYVIGVPLALLSAASRYRACRDRRSLRVSLLLSSYHEEHWYFEILDLARKFVLASVVLVVLPGTRLQLCFALLGASTFAVIYVRAEPYRDEIVARVQYAAQLQVLFTYISATVFYAEPLPWFVRRRPPIMTGVDDETIGVVLVLVNCMCFALLLFFLSGTLRDAVAIHTAAVESFADEFGLALKLPPPLTPFDDGLPGYHIFISHCWKHAQDLAGTIKHLLRSKYMHLRCFVDVDDLDALGNLELHVRHSDVVLIVLTRDYLTSPNCRREILEALRQDKPLIMVREMDENYGAITREDLLRECACVPADEQSAAHALLRLMDDATTLEWHREYHLKQAALTEIMDHLHVQHGELATSQTSCASQRDTATEQDAASQREEARGTTDDRARTDDSCGPRLSRTVSRQSVAEEGPRQAGAFATLVAFRLRTAGNVSPIAPRGLGDAHKGVRSENRIGDYKSARSEKRIGVYKSARSEKRIADSMQTAHGRQWLVDEVYVNEAYANVPFNHKRSVLMELTEQLAQWGIGVTSNLPERSVVSSCVDGLAHPARMSSSKVAAAVPIVIFLAPGVFRHRKLVREWRRLLSSSDANKIIIPLYSTSTPFSVHLPACPDELMRLGLFDTLFQKWPHSPPLKDAAVLHALTHTCRLSRRRPKALGIQLAMRDVQSTLFAAKRRSRGRSLSVLSPSTEGIFSFRSSEAISSRSSAFGLSDRSEAIDSRRTVVSACGSMSGRDFAGMAGGEMYSISEIPETHTVPEGPLFEMDAIPEMQGMAHPRTVPENLLVEMDATPEMQGIAHPPNLLSRMQHQLAGHVGILQRPSRLWSRRRPALAHLEGGQQPDEQLVVSAAL